MADFRRLRMREMTTGDVTLVLRCTGRLFLTFGVAFRAKKGKAFSPLSEMYLCNKIQFIVIETNKMLLVMRRTWAYINFMEICVNYYIVI